MLMIAEAELSVLEAMSAAAAYQARFGAEPEADTDAEGTVE